MNIDFVSCWYLKRQTWHIMTVDMADRCSTCLSDWGTSWPHGYLVKQMLYAAIHEREACGSHLVPCLKMRSCKLNVPLEWRPPLAWSRNSTLNEFKGFWDTIVSRILRSWVSLSLRNEVFKIMRRPLPLEEGSPVHLKHLGLKLDRQIEDSMDVGGCQRATLHR